MNNPFPVANIPGILPNNITNIVLNGGPNMNQGNAYGQFLFNNDTFFHSKMNQSVQKGKFSTGQTALNETISHKGNEKTKDQKR